MKKMFAAIVVTASFILTCAGEEKENLIPNPTFACEADGKITQWDVLNYKPQTGAESYNGANVLTVVSKDREQDKAVGSNLIRIGTAVRNPGPGRYLFSMRVRLSGTVDLLRIFRYHRDQDGKHAYDMQKYEGDSLPPAGEWRTLVLETEFPDYVRFCQFFIEVHNSKTVTLSIADPSLTKKK